MTGKRKKIYALSAAILFVLTLSAVYVAFFHPRQREDACKAEYAACIISEKKHYDVQIGEQIRIPFELTNMGKNPWLVQGEKAVWFSYHLLNPDQQVLQFDNRRYPLPKKVYPEQNIHLKVPIRSPLQEGRYIVEFDLLQEGIAWFQDRGSQTAEITLNVEKKDWADGAGTHFESSVQTFNLMYPLLRIALEENETRFQGRSGMVNGFYAGPDYPQIWIRDSNTIIPASQYFYDASHLSSWIEEHLYHQERNGALCDWINSKSEADKNTAATDQESSAVQAAYKVYGLLGESWLLKNIDGMKLIDRLELALEYVLNHRFSADLHMVTGAHTADWGDVDMVDADQDAVYVDDRTIWTADIYDQAMFYQACMQLSAMLESVSEKERGRKWRTTAAAIQKSTNKNLWQEDKGFYTIHRHLQPFPHDFDESSMFALGGNISAITSGLADKSKAARIIKTALERQNQYRISTISGTLLPPYPKNTFRHPLMDQPYEYQNGGQWDWFGGRAVLAMFDHGFSSSAKAKLREIMEKNIHNRGLYEWDTRQGAGRGSDMYAGSAGVLTQAVIEGYYGIKLSRHSLLIEPKLEKDSGRIHVQIPANDLFAAYTYRYDPENSAICFSYNSNFPEKGTVRILLPEKNRLRFTIDGIVQKYEIKKNHLDTFIEFQTDFNDHTAAIQFNDKD